MPANPKIPKGVNHSPLIGMGELRTTRQPSIDEEHGDWLHKGEWKKAQDRTRPENAAKEK